MKKIKILMLHLNHGGVEKQTITMANALATKYNIEIVSFYKINEKPAYEINPKIKIKYLYNGGPNKEEFKKALNSKKLKNILKEGLKATKILYLKKNLIKKEILLDNADIFFSTRTEYGSLLSKYGNKSKLKLTQEHNFIDEDNYRRGITKNYKNLDYVVVISKYHEEMYNKWFKKTNVKIARIPNILNTFPKQSSNLNNNTIIAVGRLNPIKDFISLVEIMKEAIKENPNLKLYLLGDGEEKNKIESEIKKQNLEGNIIMPGYVSAAEVEEYMLKSDIYVMTSFKECFPMVLLEAGSCGIPQISFDILTGPKEIIEDGKTGFLIPNRDKTLMAKKINNLLKDDKRLNKFSQNAKEKSKNYKSEVIMKDWIKLFEGE